MRHINSNSRWGRFNTRLRKNSAVLGVWVGTIGILIGIAIAYWSIKSSERIANLSGSFDRAIPQLLLGGHPLTPNKHVRLFYGADFKSTPLVFFKLPLGIRNTGRKTLSDVALEIRSLNGLSVDPALVTQTVTGYTRVGKQPERLQTTQGPVSITTIVFPDINPDIADAADEPIALQETAVHDRFPVETKDHDKEEVEIHVQYSIEAVISVTARDTPIVDYYVDIAAVSVRDQQALRQDLMEFVSDRARQYRHAVGFVAYLASLLANTREEAYLVFPKLKISTVQNAHIGMQEDDASVTEAVYDPVRLRYLFSMP